MSRKCPNCEKTVYMGEQWILSDHLQTLSGYILTLTQMSNNILYVLQRSSQEMSTNERSAKSLLILWRFDRFNLKTVSEDVVEQPVVYGQKSKILSFWLYILIYPRALTGEKKESLGNWYHPLCLKCKKCGRQLATGNHAEVNLLYNISEFIFGTKIRNSVYYTAQYNDSSSPLFMCDISAATCTQHHHEMVNWNDC